MVYGKWIPSAWFAVLLVGLPTMLRAQSPQPAAAPSFSLSVNGSTDAQVYQGWAWLISGSLSNPNVFSTRAAVTPLVINAQNGSWANTIQLVVTDGNGVTQNWPIRLTAAPPSSITLDAFTLGDLTWVISPSITSSIAPGTYGIVGILNTTASAGTSGWNGTTDSPFISVQVGAAPSPITNAQQEEQSELLAMYDHLLGNDSQAVADLNTLLIQQPNAFEALALKGDFLEQLGQTANALAAYDQAVAAFYAATPGPLPEAPGGLLSSQGMLRGKLLSESGLRGVPRVAIQVLNQGVQSPGVIFNDLQITNIGSDVAENIVIQQLPVKVLSGGGQVTLNNILTPKLPVVVDFLKVNASATVRIYLNLFSIVTSYSLTETGIVDDIFGTPSAFTETQTLTGAAAVPGDLNGDGSVGCDDLAIVKASFGKKTGQVGFDVRADVNHDGVVNILDLSFVARLLPAGTVCQ
jgi:Dockerin type I domain